MLAPTRPQWRAWGFGKIGRHVQQDSAVLNLKRVSVFFSHGAKKLHRSVVWPSHEMLVRGYETQRTDSFEPYVHLKEFSAPLPIKAMNW